MHIYWVFSILYTMNIGKQLVRKPNPLKVLQRSPEVIVVIQVNDTSKPINPVVLIRNAKSEPSQNNYNLSRSTTRMQWF